MNLELFVIILSSLAFILFTGFFISIYSYIKRRNYIQNFSSYVAVLDYYMEKAYELIHKDRILAYSLEAYRLPDDEYEKATQDYVILLRKYLGPTILKELVGLYGNEESFLFVVLDYFNRRYEEDEIRRSALDNITQEE